MSALHVMAKACVTGIGTVSLLFIDDVTADRILRFIGLTIQQLFSY